MIVTTSTELFPVAEKRSKAETLSERVEFVAAPSWVRRIEAQADRMGVSVAAYIRIATTRQLELDEAAEPKKRKAQ